MKSKPLNKSTAEKIDASLSEEQSFMENLVDKFEDSIEGTRVENLYYWFYRKFRFGYLNPRNAWLDVKYGVQNLVRWFPIIWKDRDWDYHFWIDMNIKKLEGMEDLIRNHGNHLYHVRDADSIRLAILALKRIKADDYHENAFINHEKKWGKLNISWIPCEDSDCSQMVSDRENIKTESDEQYELKASRKLFKHSDYMKNQDLEYATMIIKKYLFHWWD